jgi:thiamine kinase-like enzyme
VKAKHRHKSFCAVCYRLDITDQAGKWLGEQIFYLRARREGHSLAEFQQAQTRPLRPPRFGRAVEHLPELDATLWAFPNDPQLPHLPLVIDPECVVHYLPPSHAAVPTQVEIVHYYPEVRCTTRYTLPGGAAERPQTNILYGKTFKNEIGELIYQRMEQMWRWSQTVPDAFLVTRPLAYNAEVHTIWQPNQPGSPLHDVITARNYRPLLEQLARGLARLHETQLAQLETITLDDHLAAIRDKSEKLSYAFPQYAADLQALVASLEESARQLPPPPQTLIHGEFHIHQLFVHEGRIILFDFDEMALGDPVQDVANFIADLQIGYTPSSLTRKGWTRDFLERVSDVFGRAYARHARWPVPAARLRWHLQVQFLTRAYRSYRLQAPGMADEVARMIALAQAQTTADSRPLTADKTTAVGRQPSAVAHLEQR